MSNTVPDIQHLALWFRQKESMTQKKLQKLCYYAVAWGYALMDRPIVTDPEFQAWAHGPVSPTLYQAYKSYGWNSIRKLEPSDVLRFDDALEELLESVWVTYGDKDGNELEALSHGERPWVEARGNTPELEACKTPIKDDVMKSFYRSIHIE